MQNLTHTQIGASTAAVRPLITRREEEVLFLIAHEYNTREIAETLYISYDTALSHRKNLLRKMKVKNVAGMVRVAFQSGILGR